MEIEDFRREYLQAGLRRRDLREDPIEQFESWLAQAISGGITDPTAMVVATVGSQGKPWQRMVLLKDFGPRGFVFYSNTESRKSIEIAENPQVSLLFPWNVMERQVIVGGHAEKMSATEVARYFMGRPRESQLAAWASAQSRPISARQVLLQKVAQMRDKYKQGKIPLPSFWGGYRVVPEQVEFWQGGEHRLHDRFLYTLHDELNWSIERLSP